MDRRVFYFLLALGAGLVLYLSWVPVPKMAQVWFVPGWLAHWADENRNDDIRTAVPLVVLGWLVGGWLARRQQPWRQWLLAWATLSGLVLVAEVGQLFLANRSFDLGDIGWGMVGALLGLGSIATLSRLYHAAKL